MNYIAVVLLAVLLAACGAAPSPTSTPSASPSQRTFTADDLSSVLVSEATAPDGLTVESGDSGAAALVLPIPPGGPAIDEAAFVDALTTRIGHTMSGGYTSWSAVFETAGDAQQAFHFIAEQHEAGTGWDLEPLTPDVELADQAVQYAGPYGPWDTAEIYFWREGNLLLAAIGVGDFEADVLRSIAQGMDARAD